MLGFGTVIKIEIVERVVDIRSVSKQIVGVVCACIRRSKCNIQTHAIITGPIRSTLRDSDERTRLGQRTIAVVRDGGEDSIATKELA